MSWAHSNARLWLYWLEPLPRKPADVFGFMLTLSYQVQTCCIEHAKGKPLPFLADTDLKDSS
jgi:hypothetical protein